jgi:hypothetical protein
MGQISKYHRKVHSAAVQTHRTEYFNKFVELTNVIDSILTTRQGKYLFYWHMKTDRIRFMDFVTQNPS